MSLLTLDIGVRQSAECHVHVRHRHAMFHVTVKRQPGTNVPGQRTLFYENKLTTVNFHGCY